MTPFESESYDRWLAMQYVLGDANADREAIEARMANELEFAEKVSEAVLLYGELRASKPATVKPIQVAAVDTHTYRFWRRAFLGLAASAALLLFWLPRQEKSVPLSQVDLTLASVADVWTSFQSDSQVLDNDHQEEELSDARLELESEQLPEWLVTATLASSDSLDATEVH